MKRFLSILVVFMLTISLVLVKPYEAKAETVSGYDTVAENSKYIMSFNKTTTDIMIIDKATGQKWTTYPEDWGQDKLAKGITKNNMASHISLETLNDKGEAGVLNTYTQCVMNKDFKYKNIDNGLRIDYNFSDDKLKIAIEFTLTDFGMSVKIPHDSVVDNEKCEINTIKVLPFFGAATSTDNGYLFIPDGSGAIIDFNKNYGNYRDINRPVYGNDNSKAAPDSSMTEEGFKMPVFGIKKNDGAFLGVISGASTMSNVVAGVNTFMYGHYRTYATFTYRDMNSLSLMQSQGSTYYKQLSPKPISTDMVIDYHLLNGKDANYSGMAEAYRNYLIQKGDLKKTVSSKPEFDLTLIGGLKMKSVFLGIPITTTKALTTFKEAQNIISELKKKGIDSVNLRYLGYNSGGYMDQWTKTIAPAGKLGGKSGLNKLQEYCKSNDVNLFLSGELMQVHKAGNGFSTSKDAVRSLGNGVSFQYSYTINTNKKNNDDSWYLLAPQKIKAAVQKFTGSAKKLNLNNIALEDIGQMIYSDYNKSNYIYRDKVEDVIKDAMKELGKGMDHVMVTGGNAYTLPYVTDLMDVSLDYSNYEAETESIPFYEMVVHGYKSYSGNALNFSENKQDAFLRSIEYGAVPQYIGIGAESSVLKESKLQQYYSCSYMDWIDDAAAKYNKVKEAYSEINDKVIKSHTKLQEGIYKTTYENGVSIIVNYNDVDYTSGNITVRGKDFVVTRGENNEK